MPQSVSGRVTGPGKTAWRKEQGDGRLYVDWGETVAAYSALYRTYRPRRLADLVGQSHITRTLANAIRQGRVAHAYLFCGPRGTGKTSTARILAAALNCEDPRDGDACGVCARCREVAEDRLVDVREIDAASHRQVEDMRALRETVGYAPAAGRHKVYILDEVHMLTEASWNTLLKTLEEPPPETTFVLCTTDPRKVLATVVSRCQRFEFRRYAEDEITAHLADICAREGIRAEPEALAAIARRVDGGMRDALSILDQAAAFAGADALSADTVTRMLGAADDATAAHLLSVARQGDARGVFSATEALYADGKDMAQVARDLLHVVRRDLAAALEEGGGAGRAAWCLQALQTLADAEAYMRWSPEAQVVLEVALLRLAPQTAPEPAPPLQAPQAEAEPPAPTPEPQAKVAPQPRQGTVPVRPEAVAPTAPSDAQPQWHQVLEQLRKTHIPTHALLATATGARFVEGTLHVHFTSAGQAEAARGKKSWIEQAWKTLGGGPLRIAFESGPSVGPRPDPPAPEPPARSPGAAAPESAFDRALRLFDGKALR